MKKKILKKIKVKKQNHLLKEKSKQQQQKPDVL